MNWPGEYRGRDATVREYATYLLECARAGAPDPVNVIGLGMVGPALIAHGTPSQRAHLAGILSADEIWCQLFSEPDAGSDLGAISTRTTPRPGGGWTVNGRKVWTSWGVEGDWGLLLARTGDPGFRGLSLPSTRSSRSRTCCRPRAGGRSAAAPPRSSATCSPSESSGCPRWCPRR